MWLLGCLGFCGALLAFVLSFVPPGQISTGSNTVWYLGARHRLYGRSWAPPS